VVAGERASTTTRPQRQVTMNDESMRRMTKWERQKIGLENNRGRGELPICPKRAFFWDEKKEEKKSVGSMDPPDRTRVTSSEGVGRGGG